MSESPQADAPDAAPAPAPAPMSRAWLVACERCGIDRRLSELPLPRGFWYCEYNPDTSAERCAPTVDVPLRTSKMVKRAETSFVPRELSVNESHAEEMLEAFPRLKREAVEQEVTLASGWVGVYKRRKKGEGGDVYMTRPGEKPLRSTTDIQRYWGLVPAPTRGAVTDAE